MKKIKREAAITLRKKGKSYSEIQKILTVSKSTLSRWLKEVYLKPKSINRLKDRQRTAYLVSKKRVANCIWHHESIKEKARIESKKLINDSFFVAGLMLYWSEGSKSMGSVQFSNSDSQMIKIMLAWFKKYCKVQINKFKVGLILNSLHSVKECEKFWQKVTCLPIKQFHKSFIKKSNYLGKKNKLYMGTCKVIIHSRDLLSKIIGWKEGIEESFLKEPAYV